MAQTIFAQLKEVDKTDVVIGVDTHKEFHLAVALEPNGARLVECSIPANRQGYGILLEWSLGLCSRPVFAIEGTGSFGTCLCRELLAIGITVLEINLPDRFIRRRMAKDDAIDAEAAARSFLANTARN